MTDQITVNANHLADILSENSDAQCSQCRVDCSKSDGELYFAQPGEAQGDDFTIYDFQYGDIDLTNCDELVQWLMDTIELPENMVFVRN